MAVDLNTIWHILGAPRRWMRRGVSIAVQALRWRILYDRFEHKNIALRIHFVECKCAKKRVTQALDLIEDIDPVSFARTPKLLPGGIVADASDYSSAWYSKKRQACFVATKTLKELSTELIALCIIHEMGHARLTLQGFGYEEDIRVRVEKICVRRELAFARKLEAQHIEAGYYTDWVQRRHDNIVQANYTDESFRVRFRRERVNSFKLLKKLSIPRWFRAWILLKNRRMLREHRRNAASPSDQTSG